MTRQEIIKAIETCYEVGHDCTECPLFSEDECNDKLGREVITLLKEQEEQIKTRDESLKKAREEIKWLRGMLNNRLRHFREEQEERCKQCAYKLYSAKEIEKNSNLNELWRPKD